MIKTLYPSFRRWSKSGSVWLISDTHFDDPDRESMGYKLTTEDHFRMIKLMCHKNDTLIHLGDVGNKEYFKKIRAYKVLILGNHDHHPEYYRDYFDEIYDGPLFIAKKILLSHEPIIGECYLNIHGHNHIGEMIGNRDINLAANVANYIPISLDSIIKTGILKEIKSIHRQAIDKQKELKNEKTNS